MMATEQSKVLMLNMMLTSWKLAIYEKTAMNIRYKAAQKNLAW